MVHPMLFFTYRQLFQMLAQYMLIGSVTFMLLVGCGQESTNSPQFETSLRETQALGNDLSERFYHAPNHVLKQKFKTPPERRHKKSTKRTPPNSESILSQGTFEGSVS